MWNACNRTNLDIQPCDIIWHAGLSKYWYCHSQTHWKNLVETMEWVKPFSDTRRRNMEEHRCPISWVECKCKLTAQPVCLHWRWVNFISANTYRYLLAFTIAFIGSLIRICTCTFVCVCAFIVCLLIYSMHSPWYKNEPSLRMPWSRLGSVTP